MSDVLRSTRKVVAYVGKSEAGSVMISTDQHSIQLNTGWQLPIIKVNKLSHSYEVHIEPHHKNLHPSRW